MKEILLKLKHPGAQTRGCPEEGGRMGDRVSGVHVGGSAATGSESRSGSGHG